MAVDQVDEGDPFTAAPAPRPAPAPAPAPTRSSRPGLNFCLRSEF
jgi:hypothetical protein